MRSFDSSTGYLLHEQRLHDPIAGQLLQPEDTGTAVAFGPTERDVYVLTNGHIIRRVDRKTNDVKWGWTAPDQTCVTRPSSARVTTLTLRLRIDRP